MRRITTTCIGVALALTFGMATKAEAQCTQGPANAGPFHIEGCVDDATNSGVAPGALKTVDPAGNSSELGPSNGSTNQLNVIHLATPPMLGTTSIPAKIDLNTVYTQSAVDTSTGHLWFYFGWLRDATTGSGFLSIEFQHAAKPVACNYATQTQAQLIANCNPWANRQNGDFMVLWDQTGGSTAISVRFFENGAFQPPVAVGAAEAVASYNSDNSGGEVGIDFAAIVGGSPTACLTFANTIPGTLTGNSDNADYKDTVLSNFPLASNCGVVTVTKNVVPTTATGSFPFTLATSPARVIFGSNLNTPDVDCDATSTANLCHDTLTFHGDSDEIQDLLAGSDFTLVESPVPSNFGLTSIVCTLDNVPYNALAGPFPVAAAKTTACVITNTLLKGRLRIVKTVINGFGLTKEPKDFSFSLDSGVAQPFANGATGCVSGATCKDLEFDVATVHTVTEPTQPDGYNVSYSTGPNTNCTNLVISATNIQTCTVTNTATQATPATITRQRVLLFDRATVSGLRRVTSGEAAMSVAFSVYENLGTCQAQTPKLGTETVTIPANQTDTSVTVGTAGTPAIEVKLDTAGDQTTVRYWRALFQQAGGTSAANKEFLTECTEITTVRIQQ